MDLYYGFGKTIKSGQQLSNILYELPVSSASQFLLDLSWLDVSMALFVSKEVVTYQVERRERKYEEEDPGYILDISYQKQRFLPREHLCDLVLISNTIKGIQNSIRRNFRSYFGAGWFKC